MDIVLAALGEPVRRRMLDALRQGERSAGDLERSLGITQPTASKHLRVLREAGLVRVRKHAQRRIYALEPAPLAALDSWLSNYRVFWTGALDALTRHLEREH
jgi:DNA-binding transcriptional ArsR family regulator